MIMNRLHRALVRLKAFSGRGCGEGFTSRFTLSIASFSGTILDAMRITILILLTCIALSAHARDKNQDKTQAALKQFNAADAELK
jgi:hypothetical protein